MKRKPSVWNVFVKKIYNEGKSKNPNYKFKQALEDASKRKSEMQHSSTNLKPKTAKQNKKTRQTSLSGGKKSRRRSRRSRN